MDRYKGPRPGRPQRLSKESYIGERTCGFTACLNQRNRFFLTNDVVQPQVEYLARAADQFRCQVLIYCFMPDHLHVMFRGIRPDSNCLSAMSKFKLLSGLGMDRKKVVGWQVDFFDHVIRTSQDWRAQASYIAMNPVRAGLVENYADYPFTGSLVAGLTDIVAPDWR